tara:strand:- start:403 stop:1275 length:873 start_codon:yes stop_codon:yes gene_type:complete
MNDKIVFMFLVLTMVSNIATGYGVEEQNALLPDTDGDGANDYADHFPFDNLEIKDTDGDGWGDNSDYCPRIPDNTNADYDNDLLGDVCDTDDDNDGILDAYDIEPFGDAEINYTILMVATQLMDIKKNQPDEPFLVINTPMFDMRTENHSGYMANATVNLNIDDHIYSQVELNISAWDSDYGVNEDDYYGYCHLYLPALNTCRGEYMRVLAVDTSLLLNDGETQEQVSIWINSENPSPKETYVMGGFFGNLWNNLMGIFDGIFSFEDAENMAVQWVINAFTSYGGAVLFI